MTNLSMFDDEYLTVKQSAEILNVSNATISNWIKLGVLSVPEGFKKKLISKNLVLDLKNKIVNGESDKLKSRANKMHVSKKRVHSELNDPEISGFLSYIDGIATDQNCQAILISIAKALVDHERKISKHDQNEEWLNLCLDEITAWSHEVNEFEELELIIPDAILDVVDILGKTYQHISLSHSKASGGVFYTPESISHKIINENLRKDEVVLDPCCGSGSFLIQALFYKIKHGDENISSCIYGYDIDPIAVHICRLNLLLLGKSKFTGMPRIYLSDVIESQRVQGIDFLKFKVDLIATNPPWGASLTQFQKESICGSDSFSLFLKIAIDNVRVHGKLALLLPESFVDISAHSQVRKKLVSECSDIVITKLGKAFKGMLTNVVLLEARGGAGKTSQRITLRTDNAVTTASHQEVLDKKFCEFVFDLDGSKSNLIKKIYSFNHTLLGPESDYSLGIVTGNNAKLVLSKPESGCEGVLKGKDIHPFKHNPPQQYIKFDRAAFQQCSDESYFRAKEKLIYRFISDRLIFSYDNEGTLTLNSANFIIPKVGIPVKVVLAILQSSVSQFLFETKFNSVKVLKKHLQELPIFIFDKAVNDMLEKLVDQILADECGCYKTNLSAINKIIYAQIGLDENEIKIVEAIYAKS